MDWVPTGEALPIDGQDILVYINNDKNPNLPKAHRIVTSRFSMAIWEELQTDQFTISGFSHWMPMPDPPAL